MVRFQTAAHPIPKQAQPDGAALEPSGQILAQGAAHWLLSPRLPLFGMPHGLASRGLPPEIQGRAKPCLFLLPFLAQAWLW